MEPKMEQKKITQGDLVSMFLRSNLQQASFNFERIHGLGFCYDMIPAIKRLYPLKADQVAALKRHLVFFNTTPAVCGPVIGVTANALAEEKQRCLESGMDSCLSKPVTLDVLKQTLTVYAARVRNGRE